MNNYTTNNYDIYYPIIKLNENTNSIILELYRTTLYNKLKKKINEIRIKYTKLLSESLAYDIMSILLFNHTFESKIDPLFDSTSPFTKKNIYNYFYVKKCLKTIPNETIKIILKIFPKISNRYIKYYNKIVKNNSKLNNIKYNISYTEIEKSKNSEKNIEFIIINFELINNNSKINIEYIKNLKISLDIFNHLVKLYYIENNIDEIDNILLENIYILYNRYYIFSSGNNQSSILPSFKRLLKEKLNIKIELFGSPLNTKSIKFGSFFYDIDYKFGSIGNYFNTKIIKGYYELNPPFDKCIIDNMFKKALNELIKANDNKQPLLFCFIIPYTYFKYKKLEKKYDTFIMHNILLKKEQFPYRRYNRSYTIMTTSPIVDTNIIVCCTNYISKYINYNVSVFKSLIDDWIK